MRNQWRSFRAGRKRAAQGAQTLRRLREIKAALPSSRPLICIGLIEHFGDILACEPVARATRERYPAAYLVWITRPAYRDLVAHHPALDEVLTLDSFSAYSDVSAQAVSDIFIDLHVNHRECLDTGQIHQKRSGNPEVTVENYYDYGTLLEAFCRSAGIPVPTSKPLLFLPPGAGPSVHDLIPREPYLVLHATSNEIARDWQESRWLELAGWLQRQFAAQLVEVGLQPLIGRRLPGVRNLCGRLSLPQLGEVIRRSRGFIGVDSGPAHFANAAERPSLILLGSYRRFRRYMPYNGFLRDHEHEMIIAHDGPTADIPVEVVTARARAIFRDFA